jgi:TIR domain
LGTASSSTRVAGPALLGTDKGRHAMDVGIYSDNTLALPVAALCKRLSDTCESIKFEPGTARFRVPGDTVSFPETYADLPDELTRQAANFDLAILATSVPYENNFFFQGSAGLIILSFNGWNLLTDLPISNGLTYFCAALILGYSAPSASHEEATGCVNDFWWDKRGVDVGMRAAFLCSDCLAQAPKDAHTQAILNDVQALLDAVSRASRAHVDLLETKATSEGETPRFDAFLCHNNADKPAVRKIDEALRHGGLRTWLDEDQLPPGLPWQIELEREIARIASAIVFVGDSGFGPWQSAEIRAFLNEFATRQCPVIPVLLPGAPGVPELPIFLRQMTWIDLRQDRDRELGRIIRFLRGRKTEAEPAVSRD